MEYHKEREKLLDKAEILLNENVSKAEKGIVSIDVPINLLKGEDLRNLYNDFCELEKKLKKKLLN